MLAAVCPPSTTITVPVVKEEASDAKNRTALAISSGRPALPTGYKVPTLSHMLCARSSLTPLLW